MNIEKTLKGWIARSKFIQWTSSGPVFDGVGALTFYKSKPIKRKYDWENPGSSGEYLILDKNMFPDLKWEDEPIEVEMVIKTKTIDYVKRKD